MRLLNTTTLQLESFFGAQPPPYAILSHTWEQEEVFFEHIRDPAAQSFPHDRLGASNVRESCRVAREDGFGHVWIDTCCIDKSSSAELSESINSMFAWYRQADVCYAYLSDAHVPGDDGGGKPLVMPQGSRWFTRAWTLQELIAPRQVVFYDHHWKEIRRREPERPSFDNSRFLEMLTTTTGIPLSLLSRWGAGPCTLNSYRSDDGAHNMRLYNGVCQVCSGKDTYPIFVRERFSNTQKMSWGARRVTTRREDQAYCLLGLFGVNMPLLYGEWDVAFIRLQEEIMRKSDDPSP